ncbi:hypothetical protein G6F58_005874 [Rhizopus delemar]|nr:hypothetical protein G6F58_005874 [Rhizopus delemar]
MSFKQVSATLLVRIVVLQPSREYRIHGHIKDKTILKPFVMVYLGTEELRELLWNRDLAACLNLIHIVRNLRLNGEISERFQRAGDERSGPTRRRRRRRPEENAERQVLPRTL